MSYTTFSFESSCTVVSPNVGVTAMEMSSWEWIKQEQGSSSFKRRHVTRGRSPIATQDINPIVRMWKAAGGMVAESRMIYIKGCECVAEGACWERICL